MSIHRRAGRNVLLAIMFFTATACSSAGSLGNVLGSVLGGNASANLLTGTIQDVDAQNQQLRIAQSNGQAVSVRFDDRTRVDFDNRGYPVTALESGDEVVARIRDAGNGDYYTDSIHVTQSGGSGAGSGSTNAQAFQGTVRQVDLQHGLFSIDNGSGYAITVSMPYNPSEADLHRFQYLRRGESVRFYGVIVTNSRIDLRRFY